MEKILHLGYGEMGPHALESLSEKFEVCAVVTPPRGTRFRTEAVEKTEGLAKKKDIPVIMDSGLKALQRTVEALDPKAVVICSYDKIIPESSLNLSTFINVHHGDLPRYRGRANLNWAIINGRDSIGVSVHEVVPKLDAGGIYKMWNIPITEDTYISDLYNEVNQRVRDNLGNLVEQVLQGKLYPISQEGEPTYCCTRLAEDGQINWKDSAQNIRRIIRAVSKPFPGAFTYFSPHKSNASEKLTIWKADMPSKPRKYEGNLPGRIGRVLKGVGVEVLTGTSPLIITDVGFRGQDYSADQIIKSIDLTLRWK